MDATATPRGISLAVGELGARGRPTFYMTSRTAVSVNRIRSLRPSTVFVDVCPRDTHTPHGLSCFCRTGISLSLEHPGRSCHIHTATCGLRSGLQQRRSGPRRRQERRAARRAALPAWFWQRFRRPGTAGWPRGLRRRSRASSRSSRQSGAGSPLSQHLETNSWLLSPRLWLVTRRAPRICRRTCSATRA